jgi:hypothetical protein
MDTYNKIVSFLSVKVLLPMLAAIIAIEVFTTIYYKSAILICENKLDDCTIELKVNDIDCKTDMFTEKQIIEMIKEKEINDENINKAVGVHTIIFDD